MTWVNLRGCSGAGKSYPGFRLLEEYGPGAEVRMYDHYYRKPRRDGSTRDLPREPKLIGHVLPGGLCLAGRYEIKKSTVKEGKGYTGGLDGWHPMNAMSKQLEDFYDLWPHGYFESLLISGTFDRWHLFAAGARLHPDFHGTTNKEAYDLTLEDPKRDIVFATLVTPLEQCLAGVQSRNGGKPVDEKAIEEHRKRVLQAASKFSAAGDPSYYVEREHSYEQVKHLLREGGWRPEDDPDPPSGTVLLDWSASALPVGPE